MLGKEIWLNNKKIEVTDSLIDLTSGAKVLSFVINRKKEKMKIVPFKFVVGSATDKDLESWYDFGLQQYTGFLEYETSITIDEIFSNVFLDLGKVKFMAEIFVNDQPVGARLWPPFKFDITDVLQQGRNRIKIKIGNLIANEMWMKEDMGILRTWAIRYLDIKDKPDLNLCNAGLFGPVKLEFNYINK